MFILPKYPLVQASILDIIQFDGAITHVQVGPFYIQYSGNYLKEFEDIFAIGGIPTLYNLIHNTLYLAIQTNITKFDLSKLEYLLNDYHIYQWN